MEKRKLRSVGNLISQILRAERFGKTEPKLLVRLNSMDRELSYLVSLKEVMSMRRCTGGLSNRGVTLYQ